MLLTEYNAKYQRKLDRRDARAEGLAEGTARANRLNTLLLEQNRIEDLAKAAQDSEYQEQLFKEFGL